MLEVPPSQRGFADQAVRTTGSLDLKPTSQRARNAQALALGVGIFPLSGCCVGEQRSERNWARAQESIRLANSTLRAGHTDEGAAMYVDLWHIARKPDPPADSPATRELSEAMADRSRENPALGGTWRPLVAESVNDLAGAEFSREQMRDFLLITDATHDAGSLVAYFESIAGDWRDRSRWNSDEDLRDTASARLRAAGRSGLALAYVQTREGVAPPPVVAGGYVLQAIIGPIMGPMMAPK